MKNSVEKELDLEWVKLELLSSKCDVYERLSNELNDDGKLKYSKSWLKSVIFNDESLEKKKY